jgi:hypothetical protein
MKQLITLLLCGFLAKSSLSQSNQSWQVFGKYEGIEIKYLKHVSDTSAKVDRMNETWGKKTLTLDRNGTFLLEFRVPYPTTVIGLKRATRGRWVRIKDTVVLNSYHPYSDFIKVEEKKVNRKRIRVKLEYTYDGEIYYPALDISINNQTSQTINTRRKKWAYFSLNTVKIIEIEKYAGPTSTDREWVYRPVNSNSNSFIISVTDNVEGNNFVVEDYKLLIVGSSLVQIDQVFRLRENLFKATNERQAFER